MEGAALSGRPARNALFSCLLSVPLGSDTALPPEAATSSLVATSPPSSAAARSLPSQRLDRELLRA
eukprot:9486399-Pyramimonas_sp.AAC.1